MNLKIVMRKLSSWPLYASWVNEFHFPATATLLVLDTIISCPDNCSSLLNLSASIPTLSAYSQSNSRVMVIVEIRLCPSTTQKPFNCFLFLRIKTNVFTYIPYEDLPNHLPIILWPLLQFLSSLLHSALFTPAFWLSLTPVKHCSPPPPLCFILCLACSSQNLYI